MSNYNETSDEPREFEYKGTIYCYTFDTPSLQHGCIEIDGRQSNIYYVAGWYWPKEREDQTNPVGTTFNDFETPIWEAYQKIEEAIKAKIK